MNLESAKNKASKLIEIENKEVGIIECPKGNHMVIPEPHLSMELPILEKIGYRLVLRFVRRIN